LPASHTAQEIMPTFPRLARPALVLLLALVALAGALARTLPAGASILQSSIMMDDNHLVYGSDALRGKALAQMQALGVDYVRVTVLWANVALGAQAYDHKRHINFNPSNPKDYPPANWNRYDNLVSNAARDGIGVYFDVTGPGPAYSHAKAPASLAKSLDPTWEPNDQQFYDFVFALGTRYSGKYKVGKTVIPRVAVWSLWNEPNQGGWITPQWHNVGGQLVPESAVIYRRLFTFGALALSRTGHTAKTGDAVLMGETSPVGAPRQNATSAMDPTTFIRAVFCVDANDVALTGTAASVLGCSDFTTNPTLNATGYAHHPYTKGTAPTTPSPNPNDITLANIAALPALLDAIAASTHRVAPGLPVLLSEYGYETNPPDPIFGTSLANQTAWINEGDYLAFLQPRVAGMTQFLLYDVPPVRTAPKGSRTYWSTYQSGLLFADGKAKPSESAYTFPFATFPTASVTPGVPQIGLWGQLRFLAHHALGIPTTTVVVQYQPAIPGAVFANIGAPISVPIGSTNPRNFFETSIPYPGAGNLRLAWVGPVAGEVGYSRTIALAVTPPVGVD
jgi:hypothetical protein